MAFMFDIVAFKWLSGEVGNLELSEECIQMEQTSTTSLFVTGDRWRRSVSIGD